MSKPNTLAMILAGGRVDELNVLTQYRPKSAVPFGGFARVIDFPLSNLMNSGIERIAILSQYRSYSLINHIGTGAAWDMIGRHRGISILPPFKDYKSPHWYRGSADAVSQNIDFIQHHAPGEIMILSGDHIYQMDYQEMISYHHAREADVTVACIKVPRETAHRFGVANIKDEDPFGGTILDYEEKSQEPRFDWASLTVFCFRPEVLYEVMRINQGQESYEFGRDILPMMVAGNYNVIGYKFRGYWGYTRTIDEYWRTSMDMLGNAPRIDMEKWGIRTNLDHRDIRSCQPLKIGDHGEAINSLVYNGCIIEGRVENSILFPGACVESGAEVRDSVLFFNNIVKKGASISRVVSDVNTNFGAGAEVGSQGDGAITVIGWNNQVPDKIQIGSGCTVHPRIPDSHWPPFVPAGEEVTQ